MKRLGMGLVGLLAVAQACGGSTAPGWMCTDEQAQFSRASVSVDPNKRMADLTADERTAVCAEFTRSLTDSFGAPEIACNNGSHDPTRQGTPMCQAWYDDCLQVPPRPAPMLYCTEKMSGMWNCPITIGQYQACFNDLNSVWIALIAKQPVCAAADVNVCGTPPPSPSCAAAKCDYTWND